MKFNFVKFILTIFTLFVVVIVVYQGYVFIYKSASTEYAVQISCEDTETTVGYFVRDEQVIYSGNSKYFDVVIANGGKVSKNGIVANVYSTENAAKIQSQIRELRQKIDEYKSVSKSGSSEGDSSAYTAAINKDILDISDSICKNDPSAAFESASDFLVSVIKYKISVGEITDYSDTIDDLEDRMDELESQSSAVTKRLTSTVSGYFSYNADGVETTLPMSVTDEITPESFDFIKSECEKASSVDNAIGKVVVGSDWRLCFKSDADKFEKIRVGSPLYIRIPSLAENKIKCSVVDIKKDNEDVYIVLQSNVVTGDILSQRSCEIEVIVDSYEGLRIDKNALRKIDGKNGVFVKSNGILRYREVNVLYIGSTYAVIEYDPMKKSNVQAYDEVVVKGSNLYDGKVIS